MAAAVTPHAEALARLAHEETGYGVVADKVQKNLFASEKVYKFIRPMKTVGVIRRLEDRKVIEIAEPFGVVCAIVPTTNPTSTAIYKILISLKARCPVVISPHPSAVRCISRVAEIMDEAARRRRRARRRDQLHDDRHARRHAGADEGPRGLGHPRDRRHGSRARGLQRGQAGLRRRAGQRARVHRAHRGRAEGRARRRHRQDVRQRRALLVRELRRRRRAGRGGGEARVREERRLLHVARGDRRGRAGPGRPAAAAESEAGRPARHAHRAGGRDHRAGRDARADRGAEGRRPRLPAVDREAVARSSPSMSSPTGRKAARAASRSCATAAWGTPCRSTRATIRSSWSSA